MHIIENVLLTIVSYQILSFCNVNINAEKDVSDKSKKTDNHDCILPTTGENGDKSPAAFRKDSDRSMITPDKNGNINIKYNEHVDLSCETGGFESANLRDKGTVGVNCVEDGNLLYKGQTYEPKNFSCHNIQKWNKYRRNHRIKKIRKWDYRHFHNFTFYTQRKIMMIKALENIRSKYEVINHTRSPFDCHVFLPKLLPKGYIMPIPYKSDGNNTRILYPDYFGFIHIKKNHEINLSCAGSRFQSPIENVEEITVKCKRKNYFTLNDKEFFFQNFSCSLIPKATLIILNRTCQGQHKVIEVGFQTRKYFFKLYRICFDMMRKTPIYSWYTWKKPLFKYRQLFYYNQNYIKNSLRTYGNIDLEATYTPEKVKNAVYKTLKSTKLVDFYVNVTYKRVIQQRELTSHFDFPYLFEQQAGYVFENTVPQWSYFNYRVWKDVERTIRFDKTCTENRQVVITGTYLTAQLRDHSMVQHNLYLEPPGRVPVPKYIWKMDYDLDTKTGLVYVGQNDVYMWFNETKSICEPVQCRFTLVTRRKYNPRMLYCCTKEEFEKAYGKIDPIVFEWLR